MKVAIEQYIQQVSDGNRYKGHVKIADSKFDYELIFPVPIPRLDDMVVPGEDLGMDEIRRLCQLTVKRNDVAIELTDDEYGFFFRMLLVLTLDFYNNPQTRASNKGTVGQLIQGTSPLSDFGGSISIGMKLSGSSDFIPQLCEMLNAPKFGCALTT